jgi:hypothetical protein
MQVDEPGRDDETLGINRLGGRTGLFTAHVRDTAILNPKITRKPRLAGPVDNRAVFDMQVEFGHGAPLA